MTKKEINILIIAIFASSVAAAFTMCIILGYVVEFFWVVSCIIGIPTILYCAYHGCVWLYAVCEKPKEAANAHTPPTRVVWRQASLAQLSVLKASTTNALLSWILFFLIVITCASIGSCRALHSTWKITPIR